LEEGTKGDLERAVAPNHPVLLYHLGFCAGKLGEMGTARTSLEKALAFKGGFPEKDAAEKLLNTLKSRGN